MFDTIEQIKADVLASSGPPGLEIVVRIDDLWKEVITENEALREEAIKTNMLVKLMKTEVTRLRGHVAKLQKMAFGAKADHNPSKNAPEDHENKPTKLDPDISASSRANANAIPTDKSVEAVRKPSPRNTGGRGVRIWPEHVERREIYMGTADKKCPCGCGGGILSLDANETLEVIPARYYVAVRQYPKYRCRKDDAIKGTVFLPRIFPKTTMSNALIANAVSMRFGWQLPWYRQESIFKSQGIDLSRVSLLRWSNRVAVEALLPIYELMEVELKSNSSRLFMDETTIPRLAPGNGKTLTSYLYALLRDDRAFGGNAPPVVMYYPRATRAMHNIHNILSGVEAIVQTDAYAGYGRLGKKGTPVEKITPVKCWAHARRNFTDEFEFNKTPDAKEVVDLIAELYIEEAKIRGKPPLVRELHRREFSRPILKRLKDRLVVQDNCHLAKSRMGQAIRYTLRYWNELTLFVDIGKIDLDTNAVERMFKPSILLRKNVMFVGNDEGAQAWGIHASIIETCKLNGVNAEPYFKWALDQIAAKLPRSEYEKLLPWNAPTKFRFGK